MIDWLRQLSWPELRHHPWRHGAALLAVMLGVALAFSVHLINNSALSEFSAAVRSVNGEPDLEVHGPEGGFDEALYERIARDPRVAAASPVVELAAQVDGVALRVIGLDAFAAAGVQPALLPHIEKDEDRFAVIDPDAVFLNAAARQRFGDTTKLHVSTPGGTADLAVRGSVAAPGEPTAVMDIAGAQSHFGRLGRLSRIELRLAPGADRNALLRDLTLPAGVHAVVPPDATQRISNVSRAYRVNLTVLALVALFTGAFLVFSVLSLSVAQRQPQLALLGVLGLAARQRLALVLAESALLGLAGSVLGLLLGTALAWGALRWLSGDLGGGYFPGVAPSLHFSVWAALVYGGLGVVAALVGGFQPARSAQRLAPAQALKGLGGDDGRATSAWPGPLLLLAAWGLALLPPVAEIPLPAYVSVACLLLGGIVCVPAGVAALLRGIAPPRHALALLAVERARHQKQTATVAVAGVVAALSLAVALTVMVASFRDSVASWLDTVLPADLYVRGSERGAVLPSGLAQAAAAIDGVVRAEAQRIVSVPLSSTRPPIALISRPLADPDRELPLVGGLQARPDGETAVYVSEAMVSLYGAAPGTRFVLPLPNARNERVFVRGVWRDYARQHGAVIMASADYRRLSGDEQVSDFALWLRPGTDPSPVQQAVREITTRLGGNGEALDIASVGELRALSMRIFDRSFAVTYWLQAVAIAIGLFGIAASFSAQVLARRKEFGLLVHLGLTRREVLVVVGAEGACGPPPAPCSAWRSASRSAWCW
jgi:putative ABC transport system permease protein